MMCPPIGIIDIVSRPPATITSAPPVLILSAASAIDCSPEEQKRLIVIAEVSTGRPARIAAARVTFMPCSASGIAQPIITSSISALSKPSTSAIASLMTAAPISSGRVNLSVPFGALPTAVRTAETMTASLIVPTLLPFNQPLFLQPTVGQQVFDDFRHQRPVQPLDEEVGRDL